MTATANLEGPAFFFPSLPALRGQGPVSDFTQETPKFVNQDWVYVFLNLYP